METPVLQLRLSCWPGSKRTIVSLHVPAPRVAVLAVLIYVVYAATLVVTAESVMMSVLRHTPVAAAEVSTVPSRSTRPGWTAFAGGLDVLW